MDEKKWKWFVAKASKLFLKDDRLWKKQLEGRCKDFSSLEQGEVWGEAIVVS